MEVCVIFGGGAEFLRKLFREGFGLLKAENVRFHVEHRLQGALSVHRAKPVYVPGDDGFHKSILADRLTSPILQLLAYGKFELNSYEVY